MSASGHRAGIAGLRQLATAFAPFGDFAQAQSNTIFVPDEPPNEIIDNCTVPSSAAGGERAGTISFRFVDKRS